MWFLRFFADTVLPRDFAEMLGAVVFVVLVGGGVVFTVSLVMFGYYFAQYRVARAAKRGIEERLKVKLVATLVFPVLVWLSVVGLVFRAIFG